MDPDHTHQVGGPCWICDLRLGGLSVAVQTAAVNAHAFFFFPSTARSPPCKQVAIISVHTQEWNENVFGSSNGTIWLCHQFGLVLLPWLCVLLWSKVAKHTIGRVGWFKSVKGRAQPPDGSHFGKDEPFVLL